jgi:hypothetical protein
LRRKILVCGEKAWSAERKLGLWVCGEITWSAEEKAWPAEKKLGLCGIPLFLTQSITFPFDIAYIK